MTYLLLLIGFVLLISGAEVLVRGASKLALILGISPLIIGLTVVAFGTSSPELAVSVQAVLTTEADVTVGNIIGSNIFNILVLLGASALVLPLAVANRLIRIDIPLMVVLSVLVLVLSLNGQVGRLEGLVLAAVLAAYLGFTILESRQSNETTKAEDLERAGGKGVRIQDHPAFNLGLVVAGLAMLALGARWLVDGATEIALDLGVSELIIGLTVVAVGTSLPEVATSIVAALKGQRDIAVGNAVGSNIFNILVVLGIAALVSPGPIQVPDAALRFDLPVMVVVAVGCFLVLFKGIVTRLDGGLFVGYYAAYIAYTVLLASEYDSLGTFRMVMLAFVVPATGLAFIISFYGNMKSRQVNTTEN